MLGAAEVGVRIETAIGEADLPFSFCGNQLACRAKHGRGLAYENSALAGGRTRSRQAGGQKSGDDQERSWTSKHGQPPLQWGSYFSTGVATSPLESFRVRYRRSP